MGNEHLRDGRKAGIDLANWLAQEEPPTPSWVVRQLNIRYGFGLQKLKNLMYGYKDEWQLDEKNNSFVRVE